MITAFTIVGSWQHALDVSRSFLFHDVKGANVDAGYIELRRNGYDKGYPHGAETHVIAVGYPGKHAYARDAYRKATSK